MARKIKLTPWGAFARPMAACATSSDTASLVPPLALALLQGIWEQMGNGMSAAIDLDDMQCSGWSELKFQQDHGTALDE